MRKQLRPFYGEHELAQVYSRAYDHTRWADHIQRVEWTAQILHDMQPASVADLSCGDAAVVTQARLECPVILLGDLCGDYQYRGLAEETIRLIPRVDVFVCSETLEHLRDPDMMLWLIRGKADRLLLTTPAGEADDRNPEHYWGWSPADMRMMLAAAGWQPDGDVRLLSPAAGYYVFQLWTCT